MALWLIRRLKANGVPQSHLKSACCFYVRGVVEYLVPAVIERLSDSQRNSIEQVWKSATRLLTSCPPRPSMPNYRPYAHRLQELGLEKLSHRWMRLNSRLVSTFEFHPCFREYFQPEDPPPYAFRVQRPFYKPIRARTLRFANSPLTAAVDTLNCLPGNPAIRHLAQKRKESPEMYGVEFPGQKLNARSLSHK